MYIISKVIIHRKMVANFVDIQRKILLLNSEKMKEYNSYMMNQLKQILMTTRYITSYHNFKKDLFV